MVKWNVTLNHTQSNLWFVYVGGIRNTTILLRDAVIQSPGTRIRNLSRAEVEEAQTQLCLRSLLPKNWNHFMKLDKYTQNVMIEGPYLPTRPTKADQVLLWLSGFVAGFLFALFVTGN